MLDLDHLAEERARALNQNLEQWRQVIWGADFQKIAQSMSDGEVETLVSFCASQADLEHAAKFILQNSGNGSPFTFFIEECERAGLKPEEWIRTRFSNSKGQ
jgi:hypothetical protein